MKSALEKKDVHEYAADGLSEDKDKGSDTYKKVQHDLCVKLLENIKFQGYKFTAVTPLTHQRFLKRAPDKAHNLRDIFGWNLPFELDSLCPLIKNLMSEADLIRPDKESLRSKVRIASLGNDLFLHSAFPTTESDAVFFGPDTYRFARFIRQFLEKKSSIINSKNLAEPRAALRILDIGCGSGAGGLAAVRALPQGTPFDLTMNDINAAALDLTLVNAEVADIPVTILLGDIFEHINGEFDLIISNPPYISDGLGRAYRDGGAQLGLDLSKRIVKTAFEHLAPGGTLLLYTGVAMTGPVDPFLSELAPLLADAGCTWSYEEIDPDVFGEELEQAAYARAHRIAAVGLEITR